MYPPHYSTTSRNNRNFTKTSEHCDGQDLCPGPEAEPCEENSQERLSAAPQARTDVDSSLRVKSRALSLLVKHNLEDKIFAPSSRQVEIWKQKNLTQKSRCQNNEFDVVLVAAEQDLEVVCKYTELYKENLSADKIIVIAKATDVVAAQCAEAGVELLDEDSLLGGLTFERVRGLNKVKPGWYFQQFLKMAYARICAKKCYLLFDGDTVPLTPLRFLDNDGKGVFIKKGEYYAPYFAMIRMLFDGEVGRETEWSFIAESMLVRTDFMLELMDRIERNTALGGGAFWEKILRNVHCDGLVGRDFSEFETYGNYVLKRHAAACTMQSVRCFREGMRFFAELPDRYALDFLSRDFDMVSFEKKHRRVKPLALTEYINRCFKT
jgi:hypothetical protein